MTELRQLYPQLGQSRVSSATARWRRCEGAGPEGRGGARTCTPIASDVNETTVLTQTTT
jgi:hypothetical protein